MRRGREIEKEKKGEKERERFGYLVFQGFMILPFLLPAVGGRLPVLRSPLLLLVPKGLSCAEATPVTYLYSWIKSL
jgi:hypothetical protein